MKNIIRLIPASLQVLWGILITQSNNTSELHFPTCIYWTQGCNGWTYSFDSSHSSHSYCKTNISGSIQKEWLIAVLAELKHELSSEVFSTANGKSSLFFVDFHTVKSFSASWLEERKQSPQTPVCICKQTYLDCIHALRKIASPEYYFRQMIIFFLAEMVVERVNFEGSWKYYVKSTFLIGK